MILNMLVAGFGGQGVLFMGKVAAKTAMLEDRFVSWLPSYGPEMRGGTANCAVCIDDREISCPLIPRPETLVALNTPSFNRFIDAVKPGGRVFIDASLFEKRTDRTDIEAFYIPSTRLAEENGLKGLGNIVMLGQVLRQTAFTKLETLIQSMKECVPATKAFLQQANEKALRLGYAYSVEQA